MNDYIYLGVSKELMSLFMKLVADGRNLVFQEDDAIAHGAEGFRGCHSIIIAESWSKEIWLSSSLNTKPLGQDVCSVCEREVN